MASNDWSETPLCVVREDSAETCGPVPTIPNANVSYTTVPEGRESVVGDLAWFQCVHGRAPSTYPGVRCLDTGLWSSLPECVEEGIFF